MNTPDGQRYFTTDRPVAVLMVFVALVVFGYFSLGQLPVTLMPDMSYPTLTVRTEYPGAAPEEVENDISRGIEEQLGVISGLSEISSISRAGMGDVILNSGVVPCPTPFRIPWKSSIRFACRVARRSHFFCIMILLWTRSWS